MRFKIVVDPSIRPLADNPDFVAKAKHAILSQDTWTKRFKWNGCWMRVVLNMNSEYVVYPEQNMMQTMLEA